MHQKGFKTFLLAVALIAACTIAAQQPSYTLYPQPQQIQFTAATFVPQQPYRFTGITSLDKDGMVLLSEVLPTGTGAGALPLEVKQMPLGNVQLQRSGAYRIHISSQKITIEAYDDRSFFYAAQTISQLVKKGVNGNIVLPVGTVTDYPDVAMRGTVEGFYGEPWSHQDRLEQLRFYGKLKLNTYIYGPKDDPFHSSPQWRSPYPAGKAAQIRELVSEAKKNKVDFVWAIHPGKDIRWNKEDSNAVLNKFEMMYDLGVRSFAVFFDDISGAGTDAKAQAGLLNFIQANFVETKGDVTPLIMCPTEYNKAWANKKEGTYLDILGAQLHPAIQVMWTGNTVVADNTTEGLEWVNKRIRRPAFVWWNFPVSDYVRDHLLLGAAYGLDTDAAPHLSGFVSNPMDKAEASKPAVFSIALYSWNMKEYNPRKAWQAALRYVMPEAPEAFQLFAAHNSDPGPNGHRYRREESIDIKPAVDSFRKVYKNNYPKNLAAELEAEFARMLPVADEIKRKSKNKRLVEQLSPWLLQYHLLSRAGVQAMQMRQQWNQKGYAAAWQHYLQLHVLMDSMNTVDRTLNQNPYQPGVKTGSLVLAPLVKELYEQTALDFERFGKPSTTAKVAAHTSAVYTNSEKLRYQPLRMGNSQVGLSPVLEVVTLKPDEFIGIELNEHLKINSLQFNLETNNLLQWGRFEVSADGKIWKTLVVAEKRGKGSVDVFDDAVHYVRFINTTDKQHSFNLKTFSLQVTPRANVSPAVYTFDGSVHTGQPFSNGNEALVTLPAAFNNQALTFLVQTHGAAYQILGLKKKGKRKVLYTGNEGFIQIPKGARKGINTFAFSATTSKPLLVYEVIKASLD